MKRLFNLFRNKYFLLSMAFVVYMIFFDKNDLFSQYQYYQQVSKLKQERDFYLKFAREKYLMKKDNEDVFVIEKKKTDDQ
jgi:hypothetical protein